MSDLDEMFKEDGAQPETEAPEVQEAEKPETEAEAEAEAPETPEEPTPEPEPEKAPEKAEEPMVPVKVVQELRAELRALKGQQTRPEPKPAPDVIEDPEGFQRHMAETVNQTVAQTKLGISKAFAERQFGQDAVREAYEALDNHPDVGRLSQHIAEADAPYLALMDWHEAEKARAEIGDPRTYKDRLKAEILKELEAERAVKSVRETPSAPSLAAESNLGGRSPAPAPEHFDLDGLLPS